MPSRSPLRIAVVTLVAAAMGVLAACSGSTIYHAYHPVPIDGWEQTDTLTFSLDSVERAGCYQVSVGLRTTFAYPYQSLWLLVETRLHHPERMRVDTLSCHLADEHGRRGGKGIDTYQYLYALDTLSLQAGQTAYFSIRHIMRREMLPGVSDVGLEITRLP